MEHVVVERFTAHLLDLLTNNPETQQQLLAHCVATLQQLGLSIPHDLTQAFLNGINTPIDPCMLGETCDPVSKF